MDRDLPISETLGVLFGVLGVDWLADGQANIPVAAAISLGTGIVIMITRYWRHRNNKK